MNGGRPVGPKASLGKSGNVRRQFLRCLQCCPVGYHPVCQSHPQGFFRVDGAAGQNHVHGPAMADDAGQPDGTAVDQGTPQRRQKTPNTAEASATRMSHISASSRPPATAYPETAAMTGLEKCMRVGPMGP